MDADTYRELQAQAARLSRTVADADDLVQDTLLVALQAGRKEPAWLHGVMGNLAMMQARSAGRRRKREAVAANHQVDVMPVEAACRAPSHLPWLMQLPASARRVAVLALHGLSAQEIQWLLDIAPTAFRQRLSRIRRHLQTLSPELQAESAALAAAHDPHRSVELQFGLVRRALKAAMAGHGVGTHDMDGHLLVLDASTHRPWASRRPTRVG